MDEWFNEDFSYICFNALSKMGINRSTLVGNQLDIIVPRLWDRGGAEFLTAVGKDNKIRYSPADITLINFTQKQILVYRTVFDLTTGATLNESTDEYFYNDIVSVSTAKGSCSVVNDEGETIQLNNVEKFEIRTSGGSTMSIIVSDPTISSIVGNVGILEKSRADEAVNVIRQMLRDRK